LERRARPAADGRVLEHAGNVEVLAGVAGRRHGGRLCDGRPRRASDILRLIGTRRVPTIGAREARATRRLHHGAGRPTLPSPVYGHTSTPRRGGRAFQEGFIP